MNSLEKDILNILASLSNENQAGLIKVAIGMLPPDKAEKYLERLKKSR